MIKNLRKLKELYIIIAGFIFMSAVIANILLYWAFGTVVSGEVLKLSHYSYNTKGGVSGYNYKIRAMGEEYVQYFPVQLPSGKVKLLKHPIFKECFIWVKSTKNLPIIYFSYFGSEFIGGIFLLIYMIIILVLIISVKTHS